MDQFIVQFDIFSWFSIFMWFGFLSPFVVAKILVWDGRLTIKELAFIVLASLFGTFVRVFPNAFIPETDSTFFMFFVLSGRISIVLLLFIYFYKLKSYTAKKAILLMIFSDVFRFIGFILMVFIATTLSHYYPIFETGYELLSITYAILSILLSALITFIIIRALRKLRKEINERDQLQTVLMCVALFCWLTQELLAFFTMADGIVTLWPLLLILSYIGIAIASFFLYSRFFNAKYTLQQQEIEKAALQRYTNEIEQKTTAVRKFKHDYQNILLSMDIFFMENDWQGLKDYYMQKIRVAFDTMTREDFYLENLSKIKVPEIKSTLITKIMFAQSHDIDITFEADTDIDYIPADSITLVRMLSIILDNAIEEVQYLGEGQIAIACFKTENHITFVVSNSCRADMPPLWQLRKIGFSTKGDFRGLGLDNLYELTDSLPNTTLQTSIKDGFFTQKIIISDLD